MQLNAAPEFPLSWKSDRARLAAHRRHHPDVPVPDELLRALRESKLAEHIERECAAAPPFSAEQRSRLAALLQDGPGANSRRSESMALAREARAA